MKLIGLLLILNGIAISFWWTTMQGTHKGTVLTLTFLAVFAGLAMVLSERITELTVQGVGTIKAAVEKAESGANEIEEIRKRVEAQAATMDLVAKESAEAKTLLNKLSEQNKIAESKIQSLTELATPPTLGNPKVNITKTDSGYDAVVIFTPSKNRPLGALAFVASIEGETDSKIIDFWPAEPPFLTGPESKRISEDGKQAILRYQLIGVSRPSIRLTTSGPVSVEIQGNHDLQSFRFKIE